jgi:hypothetical protein
MKRGGQLSGLLGVSVALSLLLLKDLAILCLTGYEQGYLYT